MKLSIECSKFDLIHCRVSVGWVWQLACLIKLEIDHTREMSSFSLPVHMRKRNIKDDIYCNMSEVPSLIFKFFSMQSVITMMPLHTHFVDKVRRTTPCRRRINSSKAAVSLSSSPISKQIKHRFRAFVIWPVRACASTIATHRSICTASSLERCASVRDSAKL